MEERPDDVAGLQAQADFLQEQDDPRGEILAAACQRPNFTTEGGVSSDQSALRRQYDRIMRGDDAIMECDEVRIFAGRRADNPEAIRALPIPAESRSLCE